MLATVRAHLGTLDAVERILKVLGFVNATAEFTQHPQVMNGFSDLMVDVFGETGRAARSAVGVSSLPMGTPVEVEAVFALRK
jgi:enamine deaminase RidA (YjgF/YER057c/UK114 family)